MFTHLLQRARKTYRDTEGAVRDDYHVDNISRVAYKNEHMWATGNTVILWDNNVQ